MQKYLQWIVAFQMYNEELIIYFKIRPFQDVLNIVLVFYLTIYSDFLLNFLFTLFLT